MGVSFHKRKRGQKPAENKKQERRKSPESVVEAIKWAADSQRLVLHEVHEQLKASQVTLGAILAVLQTQPQASKVELLTKLVEGQRALADTIMLLTAKGVTKAKEKKVTPQDITEQASATGREMGAEQRAAAATPAAPAAPVEAPKTELKVVPPVGAPTTPPPATSTGDGAVVPTQDALKSAFLAFVQKHGREKGIDLLKSFGAANVAAVPPSQYTNFHARCTG